MASKGAAGSQNAGGPETGTPGALHRPEETRMTAADAIDGLPALVLALDQEGRITMWNRGLEELTGFGREEMRGLPAGSLVEGPSPTPLRLKEGGERLVRWHRAPLTSDDGAPMTFAVGTDVTDEQQALAQTRRADRLDAVGTLASGLAHEIRNPLNAALLQLTLLRRRLERPDATPETLRPAAAMVEHELHRLDRMVDDFIAFAQPRPLNLRPTDLASLCRTVAATVAPDAEAGRVRVRLEVPEQVTALPADPERLQQVLLNLARNALEAMPDGGELVLRVRREARTAEIDVVDTGHGFPEHAPVFDAFFTTKTTGTGLGLSVVHRIVSDHAGTITARSRPGETCFTVALPA
jgi:signal transduction histidine kinase